MDLNETATQAHSAMQDSVDNWGNLLLANGGAFKPEKCFSHLISFNWRPNGKWKYDNNEENEDLDLSVPMPDSVCVPIEAVAVDEAKETLGVWSCPSGDSSKACEIMESKGQDRIDRAKGGPYQQAGCLVPGRPSVLAKGWIWSVLQYCATK